MDIGNGNGNGLMVITILKVSNLGLAGSVTFTA
jgi:hypothetical protein